MIVEIIINMIGPIVLVVNVASMFLCFRPKRGVALTTAVIAVYSAAVHFLFNPLVMLTALAPYGGMIMLPVMLLLFRGQTPQKVFAFFMQSQLTSALVHIAEALAGSTFGFESAGGQAAFIALSVTLLAAYMALVLRFGRKFCERIFVNDRLGIWASYTFGAAFSFFFTASLKWQIIGAPLYIMMILFVIWSFGVLCFTIINTHEKSAQVSNANILTMQMNALREQTYEDKTRRSDMELMRNNMGSEADVIMELLRGGKAGDAQALFADWQNSLAASVPPATCAEPVLNAVFTRFERRAVERDIRLYVDSDLPANSPVDTIRLSVIIANALDNALSAADAIEDWSQRVVRVKLIYNQWQIGIKITNPCAAPVEFDSKGLPITREEGHGIGIRSISSFAEAGGYPLDFWYHDGMFEMRLVMGI